MLYSSGSGTRATLLGRLRATPSDPDAWAEFATYYGQRVYRWCRKWGLQEADARDVTQNVFLDLALQLRRFHYDQKGCFRAWLKTVTRRAWHRYEKKRRSAFLGNGDDDTADRLAGIEARDDLKRRLREAFDEEILREAAARVRLRIEQRTWDAFFLLAIDGISGAEAAKRLGMKVATVFVARSKVQKMLSDEVARLEQNS